MSETAGSLIVLVGQTLQIQFDKITVECRVIDSRKVWDRVDLLVEPVSGAGSIWVSKGRVR